MINQRGQIMILSFVILGVVMVSTLLTIGGAQLYASNANYSAQAEKATALAEAGIDKAIESINKTGGTYGGESETALGDGSYSVTITTKDAATKVIQSTGYLPNKTNPKVKRSIEILVSRGVGVSFNYGVQVGEGGLTFGNSNQVTGSIYSNGSIQASGNNNTITGDVYVAGGPQAVADQSTPDCVQCLDFLFGKIVNGDSRLNVAQSFQPSSTAVLNKVSLRLKRFGSPPDTTVRVLRDASGIPDKNGVLTSGTLYSSLLATIYGWVDVTFSTLPTLTGGSTYWLMVTTTSDNNNYFSWENDLTNSYNLGSPKWSADWQAKNPVWSSITGDLGFKVYMGGSPTKISGGNNFNVGGNVHANTIENLTIGKDAYFQTIVNSTALTYHPGSADPPPKVFPLSDANITQWKQQAEGAGVYSGDITNCTNLNSQKVIGSVTFNSNCNITAKSPIWITGNFTINTNNTIRLDSNYGPISGIIIVDGTISLGSNNHVEGTGTGSSVLMLLSTYDSRSNGISAIQLSNTGNVVVLYADKGIIEPGNSNNFKELTGWGIKLINNGTITYDTGLSSSLFSSGPSGSYSLVKGSYQIK